MSNKKNVHLIPQTHWDREWYYSSVNSKAMCYWSMKYMIAYLEKNNKAQFLFDGQTSIIDDFIEFAPDWEERLRKVITSRQLMVGPWYTQTDNLQPMGESILRNLEIGGKIAEDMGHRMNVGYLPDSFGHNPQTPQIMRQVGIDNFTFYRGLDPKKVNNKLYFNFIAPSGDEVLGVWQTHYFTSSKWNTYEGFMKTGYKNRGTTGEVTVESYDERSLGAPIWITMGGDMRSFKPEINDYIEKFQDDKKYNFIMSNYEDAIKEAKEYINNNNVKIEKYEGELRDSFTGRAHRSIMSARMDLKQKLYELESSLIEVIEPLSVVAAKKGIDVPWKMIERAWKDLFKTSAHDSYGGCVEDFVYKKMMQRLVDALIITRSVETMLMKLISYKKRTSSKKDQAFIMNLSPKPYTGPYKIQMSYEPEEEGEKFSEYSFELEGKKVEYHLNDRNRKENYNRTLDDVILFVEDIPPFELQTIDIKYISEEKTINIQKNIQNIFWKIEVKNQKINVYDKRKDKIYDDVFKLISDASAGDTYDHSPLDFKENEIQLKNIVNTKVTEGNKLKTIELTYETKLPNGLSERKLKKKTQTQKVFLTITLFKEQLIFNIKVKNNCDNLRLRAMINLGKKVKKWEHDMQYFITERKVDFDKNIDWKKVDKNGDKWLEYPTNLSPHQKIISSKNAGVALITSGSKEHEVINFNSTSHVALTLFRALDVFSRGDMAYRPGRPSGRPSIAPLAQLKDSFLEFNIKFITNDISNVALYEQTNMFSNKAFYIKDSWDTKNPMEVFGFEEEFYIGENKEFKLPFSIPEGLSMKALYKDPEGKFKVRLLNVTNKIIKLDDKKIRPWKLLTVEI
ncbi:hypothetical protein MYMA111404_02570 [Mycoplasma marinum]|uniref:glycoside hydrolase family 38 N-terminal domain-containing protein n=1 Tax=Mycoplasma marinum TaxID=1937190 RepID=UPI003B38663E